MKPPGRTSSPDLAARLNAARDGWNEAMDIRIVSASADEVVAEWTVGPQHLQPYGLVHGGVYCGVVETVASLAAGIASGRPVVGLENHTTFLHATREGTLRATARPLTRGRRTQVWEVGVTDASGRMMAAGRVRLLCLEQGEMLGGQQAADLGQGVPTATGSARGTRTASSPSIGGTRS